MIQRRLRDQQGFTLAELLVACAIIGVVMAGLFSILKTGQQTYLTGTNQVETQQALRLALLRVTNEVREAGYCPTCSNLAAGVVPFSSITNTSATGFTLQNDWNGSGSISTSGTVTQVVMGGNGATSNVVRGEQTIYSFSGNSLRRQEIGIDTAAVDVVSNLASISFTYLDANGTAFVPVASTYVNVRTVVINVVGQPQVQAASFGGGRVQVAMTDSVRLRNRTQ